MEGHPELVASGLHVHGPGDSGMGHVLSSRGKQHIQMCCHWFDGNTKLLHLARSSAASLQLRHCYAAAPDVHRNISTEISDLQSGL